MEQPTRASLSLSGRLGLAERHVRPRPENADYLVNDRASRDIRVRQGLPGPMTPNTKLSLSRISDLELVVGVEQSSRPQS